ncbi:MAG: hypothetical protein ABI923_05190 [bacterium]
MKKQFTPIETLVLFGICMVGIFGTTLIAFYFPDSDALLMGATIISVAAIMAVGVKFMRRTA